MEEMYYAEQPASCSVLYSLENHIRTQTHTWQHVINIVSVVAIMVVRTNYSAYSYAWSSKCVVTTAEEKLHGSQHY